MTGDYGFLVGIEIDFSTLTPIMRMIRLLQHHCQLSRNGAIQELHWIKNYIQRQKTKTHYSISRHNDSVDCSDNSMTPQTIPRTLNDKRQLESLVHDRCFRQKPLQYILESQPFCALDFITQSPILIPRFAFFVYMRNSSDLKLNSG